MRNIVGLEIKRTNLFVTTLTDKGCFLERLLAQKKEEMITGDEFYYRKISLYVN